MYVKRKSDIRVEVPLICGERGRSEQRIVRSVPQPRGVFTPMVFQERGHHIGRGIRMVRLSGRVGNVVLALEPDILMDGGWPEKRSLCVQPDQLL